MNMSFWNQIRNLLSRSKQSINESNYAPAQKSDGVAINQDNLVNLMQRLENTLDDAYSCEEAYALLDEYVELVATDEEAKQLMPLVKNHIDMCQDCRKEFEILLHILQTADSETT